MIAVGTRAHYLPTYYAPRLNNKIRDRDGSARRVRPLSYTSSFCIALQLAAPLNGTDLVEAREREGKGR